MRKITLATLGVVLVFLGVYLFPFGQDIFFYFMMDLGGGEYWVGIFYSYIVTTACIITGTLILKPGIINIFGGPVIFSLIVIGIIGVGYLTIKTISG